ncbi:hypothetical protein [uncultured Maribacter sp.]|uniref:hypothetical protein n=1 Tax=uncultured Maribacter sp. TaxID=431308 RepID=UPI00260CCCCB|nr:hypothetical protein [uncultured Maribacter sp.]
MENSKKAFFILLSFFIIFIISLNYFMNIDQLKGREAELKYFNEFDLNMKGVVCKIEKQTDTYKFLIGLKVFKSNYENYSIKKTNAVFCVKQEDYAVFADHNKNYAIGDTIEIGYSDDYLIKCMRKNKLKFIKKREEMMLYKISSPTARMKELVSSGCP